MVSLQTQLEICGAEVSHLCNAVGFSVGPIAFSYSCNWILIIQPMQCHYMNMTLLLELRVALRLRILVELVHGPEQGKNPLDFQSLNRKHK